MSLLLVENSGYDSVYRKQSLSHPFTGSRQGLPFMRCRIIAAKRYLRLFIGSFAE
jgi:hypothetical protein